MAASLQDDIFAVEEALKDHPALPALARIIAYTNAMNAEFQRHLAQDFESKLLKREEGESPEDSVAKNFGNISTYFGSVIEQVAGEPLGFLMLVFASQPGRNTSFATNKDRSEVAHRLTNLLIDWAEEERGKGSRIILPH